MRQIKFKYYMQHEDTGYITSKIFELEELESYDGFQEPHRYFTLKRCQFIGLSDKQGVEIYEGDIISLANNGEIYGVVIFDDGVEFGLPCFCIKSSEGHCENFFDSGDEPRVWFEIIGNIYQNAELLE